VLVDPFGSRVTFSDEMKRRAMVVIMLLVIVLLFFFFWFSVIVTTTIVWRFLRLFVNQNPRPANHWIGATRKIREIQQDHLGGQQQENQSGASAKTDPKVAVLVLVLRLFVTCSGG
jgi:predicted PurR-regulated permease PerM